MYGFEMIFLDVDVNTEIEVALLPFTQALLAPTTSAIRY